MKKEPKHISTTKLARMRTELAYDRTFVAAERTMMAWIRTAISMISFGFSIYKFFEFLPDVGRENKNFLNEPRFLALALTGLGITLLFFAGLEHWFYLRKLKAVYLRKNFSFASFVALAVAIIGIGAFIGILRT